MAQPKKDGKPSGIDAEIRSLEKRIQRLCAARQQLLRVPGRHGEDRAGIQQAIDRSKARSLDPSRANLPWDNISDERKRFILAQVFECRLEKSSSDSAIFEAYARQCYDALLRAAASACARKSADADEDVAAIDSP